MVEIIKFFHIIGGTTLFGISIASFFYVLTSIQKQDKTLIRYTISASYFLDAIIFTLLILQFVSSIPMIHTANLSFKTPWIIVAFISLAAVGIIWLLNLFNKLYFLSKPMISKASLVFFAVLNIISIMIFIVIIHDAVMKATVFNFLFK